MAEPFLTEIRIFSFGFPPKGWATCNGQLLPINQNQATFSLLGTTYGGDGRVNFALPNLQTRMPLHMGGSFTLGQVGGEVSHTLSVSEMPAHNHTVSATTSNANSASASGKNWCQNTVSAYSDQPADVTMSSLTGTTGGSQLHENRSPFLTLNFCIALQGIFPSQS